MKGPFLYSFPSLSVRYLEMPHTQCDVANVESSDLTGHPRRSLSPASPRALQSTLTMERVTYSIFDISAENHLVGLMVEDAHVMRSDILEARNPS